MRNTYEILKAKTLKNTEYIKINHTSSYEGFKVIEGVYKGKEFKVSYRKQYGSYTYNIKFDNDDETKELILVLYTMGALDLEDVKGWAEMTIRENELNLQKSKEFKTAVSGIIWRGKWLYN